MCSKSVCLSVLLNWQHWKENMMRKKILKENIFLKMKRKKKKVWVYAFLNGSTHLYVIFLTLCEPYTAFNFRKDVIYAQKIFFIKRISSSYDSCELSICWNAVADATHLSKFHFSLSFFNEKIFNKIRKCVFFSFIFSCIIITVVLLFMIYNII